MGIQGQGDEDQIRAFDGGRDQRPRGRHARRDVHHRVFSRDLQAIRGQIGEPVGLQERVLRGHQVGATDVNGQISLQPGR